MEADPGRIRALSEKLREHAAHLAAAEYRWLRLLGEFDEIRGWAHDGCRTGAHWLSYACGMSLEAARERLRVARSLPGLPLVCQTFERGELTYSKVRALTRIATPETEELLIGWAHHATASQLEKIVRGVRFAQRVKETQGAEARQERRAVWWGATPDGMLEIHARLPMEEGRAVVEVIERVAGELEEQQPATPEEARGRPTWFAGVGELPELARFAADPSNLWPARRADALRLIAAAAAQHGPPDQSPPPEIVVHVDAETLAGQDGERCHDAHGDPVAAATARRLACDASVVTLVEGPGGEVLDLGRASRVPNAAMRRALRASYGGCAFPSCTNTRWLHAHHIEHWADGGPTSLDNLTLLCSFHHRLVHEAGYSVERDDDALVFHRPDGEPIPQAPPPCEGDADVVVLENEGRGLHMDPSTPMPDSYTARPDYGDAVWGYLHRRSG